MSWTESSLWTTLPYPYICQKPSSSPSSGLRREFLPLKGKVRVTGSRITVLMFFDSQGSRPLCPEEQSCQLCLQGPSPVGRPLEKKAQFGVERMVPEFGQCSSPFCVKVVEEYLAKRGVQIISKTRTPLTWNRRTLSCSQS
jgi:hypothetical protein